MDEIFGIDDNLLQKFDIDDNLLETFDIENNLHEMFGMIQDFELEIEKLVSEKSEIVQNNSKLEAENYKLQVELNIMKKMKSDCEANNLEIIKENQSLRALNTAEQDGMEENQQLRQFISDLLFEVNKFSASVCFMNQLDH